MNFSASVIALLAYGIVAIAGGIIGFAKSKSKISLISGSLSGVGLLISGINTAQGQGWGKIAGIAIVSLLVIVFAMRFLKTQKFMPAGLMNFSGIATLFVVILIS
ncbi:MAG: TMEM14 family protein [Pseudanabaena sp.]